MKILLATDGSDYSKAAIEEIAGSTFSPGTEVRIVSAFGSSSIIMSIPSPGGGLGGYYEDVALIARKSAEETVKKAADYLGKKNQSLTIKAAAIEGNPKDVILSEAEKMGAGLIVVGSHGSGAIERFLLGSVSQAVALHAKCSVLIVRKKEIKSKQNKKKK